MALLRDPGPLAHYNSLADEHLAHYFANPRIRSHLLQAGLITKDGFIVDEVTWKENAALLEHQEHVKNLLAQTVVEKTLDLERRRMTMLKRDFEELAKLAAVQRLKDGKSRRGDEDFMAFLKPRLASTTPTTPLAASPRRRRSVQSVVSDCDSIASSRSTMSQFSASPYAPPFPLSASLDRSRNSKSRSTPPRWKTATKRRPKTAPPMSKSAPLLFKRSQTQSMASVTLRYLGSSLCLDHYQESDEDEVTILQQHGGGSSLCVFRGFIKPKGCFRFISKRSRGSPYGITVYVNGMLDIRFSTCCEYKHKAGSRLGGKSGHFQLVRVQGAAPCYRCQVESELGPVTPRQSSTMLAQSKSKAREKQKVFITEPSPSPSVVVTSTGNKEGESDDSDIDVDAVLKRYRDNKSKHEDSSDDDNDKEDEDGEGEGHEPARRTESRSETTSSLDVPRIPVINVQNATPLPSDAGSSTSGSDSESEYEASDGEGSGYASDEDEPAGKERAKALTRSDSSVGSQLPVDEKKDDGESAVEVVAYSEDEFDEDVGSGWEREKEGMAEVTAQNTGTQAGNGVESLVAEMGDGKDDTKEESRSVEKEPVLNVKDVKAESGDGRVGEGGGDLPTSGGETVVELSDDKADGRPMSESAVEKTDDGEKNAETDEKTKEESVDDAVKVNSEKEGSKDVQIPQEEAAGEKGPDDVTAAEVAIEEIADTPGDGQDEKVDEAAEVAANGGESLDNKTDEGRDNTAVGQTDGDGRQVEKGESSNESAIAVIENSKNTPEEKVNVGDSDSSNRKSTGDDVSTELDPSATNQDEVDGGHFDSNDQKSNPDEVPTDLKLSAKETTQVEVNEGDSGSENRKSNADSDPSAKETIAEAEKATTLEQTADLVDDDKKGSDPAAAVPESNFSPQENPNSNATVPVENAIAEQESSVPEINIRRAESQDFLDKDEEKGSDEDERRDSIASPLPPKSPKPPLETMASAKNLLRQTTSGVSLRSFASEPRYDDDLFSSGTSSSLSLMNSSRFPSLNNSQTDVEAGNKAATGSQSSLTFQERGKVGRLLSTSRTKITEPLAPLVTGKEDVQLVNVELTEKQIEEVASVLEVNKSVSTMTFRNAAVTDKGAAALANAILANENEVKMVNFNLNELGPEGAKHVAKTLRQKPLEFLLLHGNPIGDAGFRYIVNALVGDVPPTRIPHPPSGEPPDNRRLTRRRLRRRRSSDSSSSGSSLSSIVSVTVPNTALTCLDVGDCGLTSVAAPDVARLLSSNTSLRELNISANELGLDAWERIGMALQKNSSLTSLCLDYCDLGDDGLIALCDAFAHTTTLKSVDLEGNGITDRGVGILLEALKLNSSLREVNLMPGNGVGPELMKKLMTILNSRKD
eukprot:m.130118 g.130118  ORF g.130118 m.130118 type:complete len:1377 (+) comp38011_c0_seq23:83-4213(+)